MTELLDHDVGRVAPNRAGNRADVSVAPGARVELELTLNERVGFPARVYCAGALLADVTD
jgi:hypothetical protein